MSVVSSLYTGAAGLASHGDALSVVGDNIANSNTVGFKGSRANFEDVLARSVGGGTDDIGLGSRLANVQRLLTQGALLGTGVATDLSISGNGFFMVKGSAAGLDGLFYTRAGQFSLDKDGKLVNTNGLVAQGYVADASGNLVKNLTDIQVSTAQMPPVATTSAEIVANLDATSTTPAAAWSTASPTATSNFSSTLTVYDSLGESHTVNVYYRKEAAAGAWSWHALVDGGEITGGTAGVAEEEASGTLAFDTQGRLTAAATTTSSFGFLNAVPAQNIAFDFGDPIPPGTGLKGTTSFASTSVVTFMDQNGYASGSLSGISIDADGTVNGVFSNGMKRTVGQVLLANFQSPESMKRVGGNLYIGTASSGPALVAEAASGGMGAINAGTLEQSNVDLAKQFVDMITFQRGFQANSKTITTADEMLQQVLGLKR
jgi:flagellar hook protein FlgE